jgi:hypothetical protein
MDSGAKMTAQPMSKKSEKTKRIVSSDRRFDPIQRAKNALAVGEKKIKSCGDLQDKYIVITNHRYTRFKKNSAGVFSKAEGVGDPINATWVSKYEAEQLCIHAQQHDLVAEFKFWKDAMQEYCAALKKIIGMLEIS